MTQSQSAQHPLLDRLRRLLAEDQLYEALLTYLSYQADFARLPAPEQDRQRQQAIAADVLVQAHIDDEFRRAHKLLLQQRFQQADHLLQEIQQVAEVPELHPLLYNWNRQIHSLQGLMEIQKRAWVTAGINQVRRYLARQEYDLAKYILDELAPIVFSLPHYHYRDDLHDLRQQAENPPPPAGATGSTKD